jgi:hypothetical protein
MANIPRSYDLDILASDDVQDVQDARRIRRRYDLDYVTNYPTTMVHSDDDVEIVAEGTRNQNDGPFICQICSKDLGKLDASRRQEHYETHFNVNEALRDVNVQLKSRPKWKDRFPCNNENDVFWYSALTEPPPSNYTPGNIFCACLTVF